VVVDEVASKLAPSPGARVGTRQFKGVHLEGAKGSATRRSFINVNVEPSADFAIREDEMVENLC